MQRRHFLKTSGIAALPSLAAALPLTGLAATTNKAEKPAAVYFFGDGPNYTPAEVIVKLQQINTAAPIERDSYGEGGAVKALEAKFIAITGKEAAMYMTSGTQANQLAISVLSGENTKVFVQDTSHVYRDEADAAQSLYNKRLIPLAPGQTGFTLEELQTALKTLEEGEVFKSGIGAVSIENPVRRSNGCRVDLEEIKKISAWCREKGYKLHLDGARIHMAVAFGGTPLTEYARHFDTVYISLYKYLGAPGGAMLCGDKVVIDKMRHLIKIHGGAVYQNWVNAAMALHHLEGLDEKLTRVVKKANELFASLNQLPEVKVTPLKNGTNIFSLQTGKSIDNKKFRLHLRDQFNIFVSGGKLEDESTLFMINETLLVRDNKAIVEAFKASLVAGKV